MHGGSGTPKADLLQCMANGIAKINVHTEISSGAVARSAALPARENPHVSVLSLHQVDFVKETVKKYIAFFRSH